MLTGGRAIKPRIENLEMHVSHACNLTCESCSHFSNQHHNGNLSLEAADAWMAAWSHRIDVTFFKLLGGEPTINPDLPKFLPLVRKHWPQAEIWIMTNGFFLHRHPDLPAALLDAGNCHIHLSVHHKDQTYLTALKPSLELLENWKNAYNISAFIWMADARWTRRYIGFGNGIRPFTDREPRKSWEACAARSCRQLFESRIWKCSPLAYLQLQSRQYNLSNAWEEYLNYVPLSPECADEDIHNFLALEDEAVCSMCPARPAAFDLPNPLAQRHRAG